MSRPVLPPDRADLPPAWRRLTLSVAVVVFVLAATSSWLPGAGAVTSLLPTGVPGLGPVVGLVAAGARALLALGVAALVWWGAHSAWPPALLALLPLPAVVLFGTPLPFATLAVLGGVVVVAAWQRPLASVLVAVLGVVVVWFWISTRGTMLAPFSRYVELVWTNPVLVGVLYTVAFGLLLALGLGARVAVDRELDRRWLVARSEEVEQRDVVVSERARLARDLHDVVAHHVSLIAVRAETAPYTHPDLGTSARSVLGEIADDARLALDELRGVLGILSRSEGDERSPQPGWADVEALVERSRGAGVDATLHGDLTAAVSPATGYVVYRVVQEALTNARRHAPDASVTVTLGAPPDAVTVTVRNRVAPAVESGGVGGPGRSLTGMRERVEGLGGRLTVGPRDNEFVVEAVFGSRA